MSFELFADVTPKTAENFRLSLLHILLLCMTFLSYLCNIGSFAPESIGGMAFL